MTGSFWSGAVAGRWSPSTPDPQPTLQQLGRLGIAPHVASYRSFQNSPTALLPRPRASTQLQRFPRVEGRRGCPQHAVRPRGRLAMTGDRTSNTGHTLRLWVPKVVSVARPTWLPWLRLSLPHPGRSPEIPLRLRVVLGHGSVQEGGRGPQSLGQPPQCLSL